MCAGTLQQLPHEHERPTALRADRRLELVGRAGREGDEGEPEEGGIAVGDGHGVITEYGMRVPTSFHDPELRDQPNGYYFAIIGDGTRIMPSYASRIAVEDRWAIVAYIRALQLSQNADAASLPADELAKLEQSGTITK